MSAIGSARPGAPRGALTLFVVSLLCALLLPTGKAQGQTFGILGGATYAKINVSPDEFLNLFFEPRLAPAVGVFVRLPISTRLSIEPEFLVDSKGSQLDFESIHESIRLTYAEVPVLLRYTPPPDSPLHFLRILGGPYAGWLLEATSQSRDAERRTSLGSAIQTFDFGWVGGLGVHIAGTDVDVRYGGSITDISRRADLNLGYPGTDGVKYRNRTFTILVRRLLW